MLGVVVILMVSWMLLYTTSNRHLNALGFNHPWLRCQQVAAGLLLAAVLCLTVQCADALLSNNHWRFNLAANMQGLGQSLWWDVKSVLTEELVFRGALLWLAVRHLGQARAIALSAVAFGVYHWFSFGIMGQVMPMIVVFVGTGLMGWAFALSFVRSGSVILPFALHLGWNVTHNTLFSKGPLGDMLFIRSVGDPLSDGQALMNVAIGMMLIPALMVWLASRIPLFGRPEKKRF